MLITLIFGFVTHVKTSNCTSFRIGIKIILFSGTSEILFVLFVVIVSLGCFNVLIGISIANVQHCLAQAEEFNLGQKIINCHNLEDTFLTLAR